MKDDGVTGVGPVQLSMEDIQECREFYEDILGLNVRDRSDQLVLGTTERPLVRLRETDDQDRPSAAAGLYHLALRVPDRSSLGAVLERVTEAGPLEGTADHGVSEAIYLSDPDGNGIEIYRDRPRDTWQYDDTGQIQMKSGPLDLRSLRADAADQDQLPDGTEMGHVHLEVTDLERARQFFGETLGFSVQAAVGSSALFLGADGYHHHIGLNTWKLRDQPVAGRGLDWFTVTVASETVKKAILDRCRDQGWTIVAEEPVTIEGPDGIMVRLEC